MKVGTDGVLLGALAPIAGVKAVLDVGTGTGLVALMLAQRVAKEPSISIVGVELDIDAATQASENVNQSPWGDDIEIIQSDYRTFQSTEKFDLIVSNPPYFVDALESPVANRTRARHTSCLSFGDLIEKSASLLLEEGKFTVIIPIDTLPSFVEQAKCVGLFLNRRVEVMTKPGEQPKRVVLTFSFKEQQVVCDSLVIELERHKYSKAYIDLTKEFYLKM